MKKESLEFAIEAHTCKHDDNEYSLTITLDDVSVDMSSHCYKATGYSGMQTNVAIFHLTPKNIVEIGEAIKAQGLKLLEAQKDKEAHEGFIAELEETADDKEIEKVATEIAQVYDDFVKVGV